jgi:hypothetical protein
LIDDRVIFNDTREKYFTHIREVLHIFQDADRKERQVHFAAKECTFLGRHTVGQGSVKPESDKMAVITEFQIPKSKKDE